MLLQNKWTHQELQTHKGSLIFQPEAKLLHLSPWHPLWKQSQQSQTLGARCFLVSGADGQTSAHQMFCKNENGYTMRIKEITLLFLVL